MPPDVEGGLVGSPRRERDRFTVCRGCRGRGWKGVGTRTALALSAANDRARVTSRRRCLDCDGTGKEER